MPVVPKSFSYAQKKYPNEARNKSGKQPIKMRYRKTDSREIRKSKCAKPLFQ